MKRRGLHATLLFLLLALGAGVMIAQQTDGSVIGTVSDSTGAVVPGATVELSGAALIRPRTVISDDEGKFRFLGVPPGVYTVTGTLEGFNAVKQSDVQVAIGRTMKVDLVLTVGQLAETVNVTASAPIDVVKTESAQIMSSTVTNFLPKGRDYRSIVTVNAGIMSEDTGIQIDGASGSENVFIVDGMNTTDLFNGTSVNTVPFEFVEEIQIKTGGYEAEFGGAMGGVVSMVTKSGGNEFHGEGDYYYNSDKLYVRPRESMYLADKDPVTNKYSFEYRQYPEDPWAQHEYGFNLGGYIFKDRLWFFGAYLPKVYDTERVGVFKTDNPTTPQNGRIFHSGTDYHTAMLKLSTTLWDKLSISGSYKLDWAKSMGALPAQDGSTPTSNLTNLDNLALTGSTYPDWTMDTNVNYQPTPVMVISGRFGFNHNNYFPITPGIYHEPRAYMQRSMPAAWTEIPAELRRDRYWYTYPSAQGRDYTRDIRERWSASGDASYFFNLGGEHNIKGGYQFDRIHHDIYDAYINNYVYFYWDTPYNSPIDGKSYRGKYGYVHVLCQPDAGHYYGTVANVFSKRHAFFIQDQWRPMAKLTINAGLRAEREDIPSYSDRPEYKGTAIRFDFGEKIAPRLGAAYDVFGNSKLKIYGSWGWFYDVMKLDLAEGSFGGLKWVDKYWTLESYNWPEIIKGNFNLGGGTFIEANDKRIPSFDSLDPELKPMSGQELTIGGEYMLNKDWIFAARFVHKNVRKAIEDVGVLSPAGEKYYITNPGYGYSVSKMLEAGLPGTPEAKRNYNAFEFKATKRFTDNWRMQASYTYSRLRGNYSGLASSDEAGRQDPNVERDFDLWFMSYDADMNPIDGPLQSDRPHVVKIDGTYQFGWGLNLGIYQRFMSGTPQTRTMSYGGTVIMPENRASDGRMPLYYATDLYAAYDFKFKERYTIQFNVNMSNLFNQKITTSVYRNINYGSIGSASLVKPGVPYDYQAELAKAITDKKSYADPRFLEADGFQGGFNARFGVKFIF